MIPRSLCTVFIVGVWLSTAAPAEAQPLGTYTWQLSPFCNVITMAVTQNGSTYRLEGYDDQCGTAQRGTVTGMAVPNNDGTIELGLSFISATGAAPSTVDVTVNIATIGGPWRDSAGNVGTLIFNPGAVAGVARPAGLGGVAIDPAQIQRRVTGTCGAGEFIQAVAQDGTVSCATDTAGNGDITSVTAGTGLNGGGVSGAVALDVAFDGPGLSPRVSHSDHRHQVASESVAIGTGAIATNLGIGNVAVGDMALNLITGNGNVAVGLGSMFFATTAEGNTAVGTVSLQHVTSGQSNVAVGFSALQAATTGSNNTAVGAETLEAVTTGNNNTAVGSGALNNVTTGFGSTAVGREALNALTSGSGNVAVGQSALRVATTGPQNTAVGSGALQSNILGNNNVGVGAGALDSATGSSNTAIGSQVMNDVTSGTDNIAIGLLAGDDLTTGSDNIYIGAEAGVNNEAGTIRIGDGDQTRAFMAGVSGVNNGGASVPVTVSASGQLGIQVSSRRFKEQIEPIGDGGSALQALRPVSFFYKPEFESGERVRQYGLIAEEVDAVLPGLVVRDAKGEIQTVRYQFLAPLLLAEVQRLERERRTLTDQLAAQAQELAALRALVESVVQRR